MTAAVGRRIALSALLVLFASTDRIRGAGAPGLREADWPQFRGPTGQGHSTERGLPLEWSESRNVAWKAPVPGRGWSSPVVADGPVWLTTATKERGASLRVLAFDVETRRELGNVEVFHLRSAHLTNAKNSHPSPKP